MSWRDEARPIIARVLDETRGQPEKDVRRALREAYPWGPRAHHPYRTWLDEIARQTGRKPALGTRTKKSGQAPASMPDDPNQVPLFGVPSTDDGEG